MRTLGPKQLRVLGIAPSTRGFGFAVFEGESTLVDWGATEVKRDKNAQTLSRVRRMILHYQPDVLILPDALAKKSRRSSRIRTLCSDLVHLAENPRIEVASFSNKLVRKHLLGSMDATKHAVAEMLAERFQQELGALLPPKRRPWTSEDRRMDIFDAVALALVFRLKRAGPKRLDKLMANAG